MSSVGSKLSSILKQTLAVVAKCHHENQCFQCNDQYVHDHKEQCKQLFMIESITNEPPVQTSEDNLTISLHALTGIQPRSGHMM
jgi:hypothetical protein